jgi:hypothetical protein
MLTKKAAFIAAFLMLANQSFIECWRRGRDSQPEADEPLA